MAILLICILGLWGVAAGVAHVAALSRGDARSGQRTDERLRWTP
jgi:hypothetical protein